MLTQGDLRLAGRAESHIGRWRQRPTGRAGWACLLRAGPSSRPERHHRPRTGVDGRHRIRRTASRPGSRLFHAPAGVPRPGRPRAPAAPPDQVVASTRRCRSGTAEGERAKSLPGSAMALTSAPGEPRSEQSARGSRRFGRVARGRPVRRAVPRCSDSPRSMPALTCAGDEVQSLSNICSSTRCLPRSGCQWWSVREAWA